MSMFKKFRLEKSLSQEEMAKKLGISTNAYRNYESGKRLMPADILKEFLILRGNSKDMELASILEEVCSTQMK